MAVSFWNNRNLLQTLIVREVSGRYRGSVLGILWSFFNSVFMLVVYTFVFSVVFKARWGGTEGSKAEFALVLFVGLLVFNLFAECIARAPSLILANTNYVKKVIFPLEILPWVVFGAAFFHAVVSFLAWILFYLVIFGLPHLTLFLFPLLLLPLCLLILGLSWFLAALGVFLRDIPQVVGILITVLMFVSPIFYPISAIPDKYHVVLYMNPLTVIIESARNTLVWGKQPDWLLFGICLSGSALVAWLGFAWFQKTRKGFADVL